MKIIRYICGEAWPFGVKHAPRSVITGLIFYISQSVSILSVSWLLMCYGQTSETKKVTVFLSQKVDLGFLQESGCLSKSCRFLMNDLQL